MPHRVTRFKPVRCAEKRRLEWRTTETRAFPADWHDDPEDIVDGMVLVEVKLPRPIEVVSKLPAPCDHPATTECARCALPLCREHEPARRRRCGLCESEYREREPFVLRDSLRGSSGCLVVFGPIAFLVLLFVFGWKVALWSLVIPPAVVVVAVVAEVGVALARRARFLLERERRMLDQVDR